jgi:uncharacterized protein
MITASHLYDLITCEHRLARDWHDDQSARDPVNAFVQLLWEKGSAYEQDLIGRLQPGFANMRTLPDKEREAATLAAMRDGTPLIYGGRISAGDLLGEPDILRKQGSLYVAGDIKSGSGREGDDGDGKLKKTYAMQLALYTDILERLGLSAGRRPFIWDVHGEEVTYDLDNPQGVRNKTTWWEEYQGALALAQKIRDRLIKTEPAYSSTCKLCHWYSSCKQKLIDMDDITLLPDLGAGRKKSLRPYFGTCEEMATRDLAEFISGKKTTIKGIGVNQLALFQERARLRLSNGAPYFKTPVSLPTAPVELFYDIEVDTMRDFCYLHGVVERTADGQTRFHGFMVDDPTPAEEARVFKQMIDFLNERQNWVMYYYSPYERTWWRKLQVRYPHLLTPDDVDEVFNPQAQRAVDLYHDVATKMIWPTIDHSVKTLAKYFGFNWRDANPSGAASVEWFDRWVKSREAGDKQRIIDYNEDDCRAMYVMLDGVRGVM